MNFEQELIGLLGGPEIKKDEPMARHTSWKVGGAADYFLVPRKREQLPALASLCKEYEVPLTVIGNGTNLLVREGGLRGLVIKLGPAFQYIDREGLKLRVGAGTSLPHLVSGAVAGGLAGLEPLGGIPGTVGGALIMNAGAFGTYIGELVEEVMLVDTAGEAGELRLLTREECGFKYRQSNLARQGIISEVLLQLREGDPVSLGRRAREYQEERLRRHPRQPSAGSVFKNPPGSPAGRLIEAAGGKGLQVGGAQVSPQHANFIVNRGGATAGDILALMAKVQGLVKEKFNLELQPEVQIIGEEV
ncbi:MAG: UDP-N-acetylmuramate dehydrogenase [Firmicutes bacterium]|nr:UDP-N-acetylmuramate dehydrogenase [Bacillota bacterium]